MHRDRRSHDGRHSTTAKGRSSLTFLAPAQTFQPNREQLVCDDTDGRLISRFFSAPSQVPRRRPASHLVPMAPGLPLARRFDLFSQFTVVRRAFTLHGYSFTEQVDCNAQTSELGRFSTGKGGLPLWELRRDAASRPLRSRRRKNPPPKAGASKRFSGV